MRFFRYAQEKQPIPDPDRIDPDGKGLIRIGSGFSVVKYRSEGYLLWEEDLKEKPLGFSLNLGCVIMVPFLLGEDTMNDGANRLFSSNFVQFKNSMRNKKAHIVGFFVAVAEEVGFEPTVPKGYNGFPCRNLRKYS